MKRTFLTGDTSSPSLPLALSVCVCLLRGSLGYREREYGEPKKKQKLVFCFSERGRWFLGIHPLGFFFLIDLLLLRRLQLLIIKATFTITMRLDLILFPSPSTQWNISLFFSSFPLYLFFTIYNFLRIYYNNFYLFGDL